MTYLCDVSFLLALCVERHAAHARITAWWRELPLESRFAICRITQAGFLRLLCTRAVMAEDVLPLSRAWAVVAALFDSGAFRYVPEPDGLVEAWLAYCRAFKVAPKVVTDAYLAAFARCAGMTLLTLDEGFKQYPSLSVCILR